MFHSGIVALLHHGCNESEELILKETVLKGVNSREKENP